MVLVNSGPRGSLRTVPESETPRSSGYSGQGGEKSLRFWMSSIRKPFHCTHLFAEQPMLENKAGDVQKATFSRQMMKKRLQVQKTGTFTKEAFASDQEFIPFKVSRTFAPRQLTQFSWNVLGGP